MLAKPKCAQFVWENCGKIVEAVPIFGWSGSDKTQYTAFNLLSDIQTGTSGVRSKCADLFVFKYSKILHRTESMFFCYLVLVQFTLEFGVTMDEQNFLTAELQLSTMPNQRSLLEIKYKPKYVRRCFVTWQPFNSQRGHYPMPQW
jgi:hypothetical protein